MLTHPVSMTYIKIKNIFKEDITDKERKIKVEKELNKLVNCQLMGQKHYITRLEDKCNKFRTVKTLLKL